jgi:hypothetical protein
MNADKDKERKKKRGKKTGIIASKPSPPHVNTAEKPVHATKNML